MDSNGNIGSNHKFYRESQKKLAKEQKRLSRKKGSKKNEAKSKNYLKQQERVNRIYRHIANQRLDNLHKLSNEIANHYDVVCVESLNMQNLSNKGFKNGKATMDNSYGMFLNMLEYKLKDRGKHFVKVDKFYPSSQICSKCGARHKLSLNERTYKCSCGHVMDRDLNAAINIKREGLNLWTLCKTITSIGLIQWVLSQRRLKQEAPTSKACFKWGWFTIEDLENGTTKDENGLLYNGHDLEKNY